MAKDVYLSLGSNVGDRAANLSTAIEQLGRSGRKSWRCLRFTKPNLSNSPANPGF